MKITRFKVKDGLIPLVIQTDDHQVIQLNLTRDAAKKMEKALGKGIAEFDN